jgi:hypothetical protein
VSDPRAARSADQERVARHLIETVRRRFAGEADDHRRIFGKEPNEVVVLGVLDPRDDLPAPPSHPDLPDEPGVPADVLPPSEIGVTVWVDLPGDADEACFSLDVAFAMYLPEYPTWREQQAWMTGGHGSDADDEPRADDSDVTVGDDQLIDDSTDTDETATGAGGGTDANRPADDGQAAAAGGSVRLAPVFARHDVTAAFDLAVPLRSGVTTDQGVTHQALTDAVTGAGGRLAHLLRGRAKTSVSAAAVAAGQAAYEQELTDRRTDELPPLPAVSFLASATVDPRGGWRINLTLANVATSESRRSRPSQTFYDARFTATIHNGSFRNLGYRLADRDWRTEPEVYAHGRFCVGEVADDRKTVATNTWPIYRDRVFESRPELQPTFSDLIADPVGTLTVIADRMDSFGADWSAYTDTAAFAADHPARGDLAAFLDEARRFRRGIDLLRQDQLLHDAFVDANQAFLLLNAPNGLHPDAIVARGTPGITSWRLFQIVFIVIGLGALAAREHDDPELASELDCADVLWFPTGGGKSEAFLGLVAVALFYDRRRGKQIGVTSLIRFPLRMLSVQQLDRVLRLTTACERVRADAQLGGAQFELGYFVGRGNTPNTLVRAADDRWGDISRMASWSAKERRKNVVITTCPFCGSTDVELVADPGRVRLDHCCTACTQRIPVVISDDEVFRTLPAVVVATVDKLASVAFQPHFSHLTHGPAYECPKHGYVTFALGPAAGRRCLARQLCDLDPTAWRTVEVYDPAPAVTIQDELHLLAEDLGTLAAHYETLFAALCRAGSRLPSKVVAATATISDYENQIHQLYALTPRRFPSEGYRDGETFYATRLELTRRLFVGALPSRLDTAQFGITAAQTWRAELDRLRSLPAPDVVTKLGLSHHTTPDAVAELLFRYELQLFYANRKNDAERAHEQMRRAGTRPPSQFEAEILTGDTPLADISAAIRRVQTETLAGTPEPGQRLAAVAGTSLVSHGVDLTRLNVMHVAGMPSTNAYYVQATARAGRTDVGVVFAAFSRSFARDRAVFHFFEPHHAYFNQLVEAVSLNRFAVNAPKKTATGMLCAAILNKIARDPAKNPAADNVIPNLMFTERFQAWLSAQPATAEADLVDAVLDAYGLRTAVLDPVVASYFEDTVQRRLADEMSMLRGGTQRTIQKCFLNKPPTSFRDIDEAVEFGAYGYYSSKDFKTLASRRDTDTSFGGEFAIAVEGEEID